jgi:hypothetical protein
VRSFALQAAGAERLDVYRFVRPVPPAFMVDLRLSSYTDRIFPRIRPIQR